MGPMNHQTQRLAHRPLVFTLVLVCVLACHSVDAGTTVVADCTVQGELLVELGAGEGSFVSIPADGAPELFHGAQGGTHLIFGARLDTPDPLDGYTVSLLAEAGQAPCTDDQCDAWVRIGGFAVELEPESQRIVQVSDSQVEIISLFLVVDNWEAAPLRRVTLEVSDVCDRRVSAQRTFE